MKQSATLLMLGLASSAGLWAQALQTFTFDAGTRFEYSDSRAVKNAPYSATAVSTSTQILGDGTRITRNTQSQMARDSDGRTRREQGINAVGPWTAGSEQHMVSISDPIAQTHYTLWPDSQTATKASVTSAVAVAGLKRNLEEARNRLDEFKTKEDGNKELRTKETAERTAAGVVTISGQAGFAATAPERVMTYSSVDSGNVVILNRIEKSAMKREELGEKVIEGVTAKGTRESHVIPAGEIGNDRPIEVISESWYSDELKTMVYSKRNDPRVGETEFRLTNISRAEPARTLFEIPAGYTLKEEGRRRD